MLVHGLELAGQVADNGGGVIAVFVALVAGLLAVTFKSPN